MKQVFGSPTGQMYFIYQSNITATKNVTRHLTACFILFIIRCDLCTNGDVLAILSSYRGAFPSTVFQIQNGRLAAFFELMMPLKNCLPNEQSISVHAFHFVKCLHSHQAMSNTILHNKPLLRFPCHGEAYCRYIQIVTPFGGCFAHSSVTRQLFHKLRCTSALLNVETNKLFNDVLQMSDRSRIDHIVMFFVVQEWFVGDFMMNFKEKCPCSGTILWFLTRGSPMGRFAHAFSLLLSLLYILNSFTISL